jgi:ankyrin repeat protein
MPVYPCASVLKTALSSGALYQRITFYYANKMAGTYTKAERYAVLDQQIRAGGAPGLSQAVLAFDLTDPLDVNVSYVADGNGDAICTGKANGWLELVAGRGGRNDVDYIRLLTSFGASQSSRDRALNIALERKKMETAQELFRNDADPNAIGNPEQFLAAIRDQDKLLYTMFLTAPTPLNSFYVNQALVEAVGRDPELVALLIAHGADGMLNDAQALCTAINMGSLEETAMILINPDGDLSTRSLDVAANTACAIADENTKGRFLDMLLSAGANANTSRVHDELLEAVKRHELSLIDLLIEHGTSPDRNDAEGLRLAVTSGQIDLVQVLLRGPVPEASTSRALDEASDLEDPDIYEEIVKALVEKGVSQPSLSRCLSDAVEKGCTSLAPMLIEKGANSDYGNARSIRQALKRNDFGLFGKLLEGSCHPSVLCEVLPDAMKIQPSSERFEIMTRLLDKGVSGKELHIALQMVAGSAQDQTDYGLIETLMRHNASVDHVDKNGNCVCTAAAQQDERALDLLCQGNPSPGTVSNAMGFLPVSFATAEAAEYEQQVGMMTTLLEKGAHGTSVAQMLIKAVRDDHREKALAALVHYHANANYEHGKAIEEALNLPRISALELICTGCNIERDSFAAQLPNALNPQGFSLEKATLLARTTKEYDYRGILDKPLLDEVETNGGRREVIELLLALGASANFQHGRALQHAVGTGNVEVCCFLLDAGVEKSNISLAFPLTSGIVDRPTRYSLMQALLAAGQFSMGQDEALVQAAQEAIQHDLSHVELLLEHQASPDFNGGAAVLQSIQTMNLPLLQRFVRTELNEKTLFNAFTLARKIECTKKERHDMFETLLEVYSSIDEISKALIEVVLSDAHDIKTPCLLLDHGASLEPELGLAMQVVASAGSLELLNIFLGKKPSQNCCDESFHSATHSDLSPEQRNPVYRSLLETGITQDLISAAMLQATLADTIDQTLLNLLIDFHASLDFDAGSAVHGIVARGDLSTLIVLLRGDVSQKETLDRSFSAAMALASPDRLPDRLAIAKALLEKEPGVSLEAVSHHLAQIAKENDHDLLSLMMDYEPDPAYNSGESFISSARAGDAKSVELLTRAQVPSDIVDQAFEQLLVARTIQSKTEGSDGLQTAKILLTLSVAQHLVDRALLDGFDDRIDQLTKDLVELLIPYKPNVSGGDGKLFVDAAKISEVELFRSLASQKPDLNVVIPALIQSFEDEEELISFLEHLDECAQREETTLQNFVIFTALRKFPQGNLLAKHLLNNGCPANSKIDAELGPSIGIETMTVLIWALSRVTPEISEEIIMEILGEGHDG